MPFRSQLLTVPSVTVEDHRAPDLIEKTADSLQGVQMRSFVTNYVREAKRTLPITVWQVRRARTARAVSQRALTDPVGAQVQGWVAEPPRPVGPNQPHFVRGRAAR